MTLTLNEAVHFALRIVEYGVVAADIDYLTVVDCEHCRLDLRIDSVELTHFKVDGSLLRGALFAFGTELEHTA